ncbi:hypothetical protein QL285_047150 [Trifolium repens]|nr:hypothetical protein QL285_047150 [Trifolium repens]
MVHANGSKICFEERRRDRTTNLPPPPPPPPYQKLTHPKNDIVFSPILQPYNNPNHYRITAAISTPPFSLTSVLSSTISWFRRRWIRYLFLLLCSPLLLVFLFVSFHFLCTTEFCLLEEGCC